MHIKITSKPFSLSFKKNIFVNGEKLYGVESGNIVGDYCLKLIDLESGFVKTLIVSETSFLSDSYNIRLLNEENLPIVFNRSERWKHNYNCVYNGNKYCIKEVKKIYIILKNDIQIATWVKGEHFSFTEEDNFKILDSCTELEFIFSMCLIIHLKELNKRSP
jgi:hypothetical protein